MVYNKLEILKAFLKLHLTLNGPPASPERFALAGWALRFGLKEFAHPRLRRDFVFKPNRNLALERNLQF